MLFQCVELPKTVTPISRLGSLKRRPCIGGLERKFEMTIRVILSWQKLVSHVGGSTGGDACYGSMRSPMSRVLEDVYMLTSGSIL